MVNDTVVTVRGWVGAEPRLYANTDAASGNDISVSSATFSLGVTPRNWNRRENRFMDGPTSWYSIRCYGALAQNVHQSVHKGAPLLVRGRIGTRQYTDKQGVSRTLQVVFADSVAIDLNNVVANYHKPSVVARPSNEVPEGGADAVVVSPEIDDSHWEFSATELEETGVESPSEEEEMEALGVLAHVGQ